MFLAMSVFLDRGYCFARIDLIFLNANSMFETFKPRSTSRLVRKLVRISSFLRNYTKTTDLIFLVYFTFISILTNNIITFDRGILSRLHLLELTLIEFTICSLFLKPRNEETMNVQVVFFRLLLTRHTFSLILLQLVYLL